MMKLQWYGQENINETFWDGLNEEKEEEIIMLSRQAWIGSHLR